MYHNEKNWLKARSCFLQSAMLAKKSNNDEPELRALGNLATTCNNHGKMYYDKENWAEASRCFEQAIKLAKAIKEDLIECRALENLANTHYKQGMMYFAQKNGREALRYFEQSAIRAKEAKNEKMPALALKNVTNLISIEKPANDVNFVVPLDSPINAKPMHETIKIVQDNNSIAQLKR